MKTLMAIVGFVLAVSAAPSITGTWSMAVDSPHGGMTTSLDLKQDGTKVTGTFTSAGHLPDMKVEGTFKDGTYLVTVHHPISTDDGNLEKALYGSFLPVPARDQFEKPWTATGRTKSETARAAVTPRWRATMGGGSRRRQARRAPAPSAAMLPYRAIHTTSPGSVLAARRPKSPA